MKTDEPGADNPMLHGDFSSLDDEAWHDPTFLRGEILTEALLLEHARRLGRAHHSPTTRGTAMPLRRRFAQTRKMIRQAYAILARGAERQRDPSPAELWLLDNGHVVEGQLREIEEDLPWGYLVKLPRMSHGRMRGYPLVYAICLDYLRHTDCYVDLASLSRFVDAYQSERVLTIGELWAIPIMLRLGLVIAISVLASSEAQANDRDFASEWAHRILEVGAPESSRRDRRQDLSLALAELEQWRRPEPPSDAFLVTLLRKLREREDAPPGALNWIARQTERLETSPDELARRYHLRQASDQVSVGNAITSMRSINTIDWNIFFRQSSRVETILASDPGEVYAKMNDASRDQCRHAVEELARRSERSETEVAAATLELAAASCDECEDYRAHVGYYLIDDGRPELYQKLRYTPRFDVRLREFVSRFPTLFYLGALMPLTLGLAAVAWAALAGAHSPLWLRALLFPGMLFAASEIAIAIVNAAIVTLTPPRVLPKFEFESGIPEQCSTLVVVPTLIDSQKGLTRLLEELEVRSLANADEHLYFALLTDFPDANAEEMPGDAEILERARIGIEELNEGRDSPRFFLFHRKRLFEPRERRFMGWERKRGKLSEFNRLLRGAADTSFVLATAPHELLLRVRYVITLDTDTELPLGVARRLVATLAHPLNRPWVDPKTQRVRRGHALIQPRVGTSPMSARQSIFARLAAGPPGIDPYTTAVSDVYQDFFGEGSFVGKGIYDVDAFQAVMAGRVPDGQLLSHDLFESIYARAALASDIEVLDEQPASYSVAAGRQHRWTRGDWQLLPWLLPRVPGKPKRRPYDFRAFDAWRVFDNLRRSLLAPTLVLLSVATWLTGGFSAAWAGSLLLVSVFVVPVVGRLTFAFARAGSQLDWLGGLGGDLRSNSQQAFLSLVFLLDQALISADAIVRALYRQLVSRKGMLEWTSMRDATDQRSDSVRRVPRLLLASGLALATLLTVLVISPPVLLVAAPILLLWVGAPWIAVWVSRIEPRVAAEPWGPEEATAFRRIARKTWRFFDQFVGELDHHLPPDNFQEEPRGMIAHRTSPTNIGLYLLSVAAARDLGFISLHEAIERWSHTLRTVERLEKREGHILNWYDTETLTPLEPRYVSTVDSGNLAGYLWTISSACEDALHAPILSERVFQATLDALHLACEAREEGQSSPDLVRALELGRVLEKAEADRASQPHRLAALLLRTSREVEPVFSRQSDSSGAPEWLYWLEVAGLTLRQAELDLKERLPHLLWFASFAEAEASGPRDHDTLRKFECLLHQTASPRGLVTRFDEIMALGQKALDVHAHHFEECLIRAKRMAEEKMEEIEAVSELSERLADEMDFSFLYDEERALFSIGYNVTGARLDNSHYDLLASEARLASLVGIAKGDIPVKHWFRLGRLRAKYASTPGLLSWSGSMFEYLMPLLVTRSYPDTLLDQTCHAVIERQIEHARSFSVPWGISEAAYNVMDLGMNYQYRAFGVPGLGLKPGLGEDLVVAPYATALAALVRAQAAARNFEALRLAGLEGRFGFYESVDYTPSRLPPSKTRVIVKAFMAHHQGMTLVALSNLLSDFAMQRRFHSDPRIKACALLLEERIPVRAGVVQPETPRTVSALARRVEQEATEHLDLAQLKSGHPRGHLLGQRGLSCWVAAGGEGFLTWHGIDVSRFREDASLSSGGTVVYFQNIDDDRYWSSGYLPTRAEPTHYGVVFSVDKIEIGRRDGDVETLTEITLSPEHPAEIRRVTLTNHTRTAVRISTTSFTELSLAPRAADIAHPAFQKMFVETERLPGGQVLIAHRRKRSPNDPSIWVAQMFVGLDPLVPAVSGMSRSAFLGRAGSLEEPAGLSDDEFVRASGTLDPAFILRCELTIQPGAQARFSLVTILAESRAALLEQIEHFVDAHSVPRAFEFAWVDARVKLQHLGITSPKAHRFQRLLSAVLFPRSALCGGGNPPVGTRGRDALWSQGISGDLPIVVLRLDEPEFAELCRDLLLAHEYWRQHGVSTDLILLNEEAPSYLQPVHDAIQGLIRSTSAEGHVDQRGGVFVRRTALMSEEDLQLIVSAARVVLHVSKGSLSAQLRSSSLARGKSAPKDPRQHPSPAPGPPKPKRLPPRAPFAPKLSPAAPPSHDPGLAFENGIGGFDTATGEYVMRIASREGPPQPWSNVMSGPQFGALVTESGASFSWFENSQKYRITPWSNDPTLDPSGELFFAKDTQTDEIWSLTPAPAGGDARYEVRHGQGYSSFEHSRDDLRTRLTVAVEPAEPVKIWHISLKNHSARPRHLRLYAYAEWVLGNHRETLRVSTITNFRTELRSIFARNPFSPFPRSCAFLTSTHAVRSATGDRGEFFGRFGSRARPEALTGNGLSGQFGSGLDPSGAFEIEVTLSPGAETTFAFVIGAGTDERQAIELAARYSKIEEAEGALSRARQSWDQLLSRIQVRTPDPAFDLLSNRWLPYQVLSCRLWGRSAFFQSGGAYGFRDQLQDVMALLHLRPDLARKHILVAASRQFLEGDVQHWWHPDTGEGVRTHCSDDLLWLPWAASEYVTATEDVGLWDEHVGFLQERLLEPGRDDLYSVPPTAAESASLYQHCVRALEAGTTRGPNGLPLMRAGDWNDGMNRIGEGGQGESVWLAWFLIQVLHQFSIVAECRADHSRAEWCRSEAKRIGRAIDEVAWDGAWYRRATFDNGAPVGSAGNTECRIDAIAQSWAIISRGGLPDRATEALDSSLLHLWNRSEKMMMLLTPPFSSREPDPGYIAAYPPGIRENGGQYSHGVLWTVLALLMERRGADAHTLLSELNPIHHTASAKAIEKYQVEPYVVAADVYSEGAHVGRGGWTWYTGSASWMYRIGIEWLLGLRRRGGELFVDPCIPPHWDRFEVDYRTEEGGRLSFVFDNPEGVSSGVRMVWLDGSALPSSRVPLPRASEHKKIRVLLGAS